MILKKQDVEQKKMTKVNTIPFVQSPRRGRASPWDWEAAERMPLGWVKGGPAWEEERRCSPG